MPGDGSLRRGAPARGPPKHQNAFAFKHNKNSKKTKKIQQIAHQGLCKRCNDKIEWRKKYRKYKPLTAPGICNGCKQRTVKRAYHTLCDSCAGGRGVCAKCTVKLADQDEVHGDEDDEEDEEMDANEIPAGVASSSKGNAQPLPSSTKKEENLKDEDDEEDGNEDEDASMEGDEDIDGEEEEDEYDEEED